MYVDEVPQLKACYSQGGTIDELMTNIRVVIEMCLKEPALTQQCTTLQIPFVSDDEQANIEASLAPPKDYDEDDFIDLTNWVRHGGSI
nr:type II toxin-antitoxin system HicB family antitoxin [Nodosilinea sp. LEGE 07298]